jgi:MscS family membrane protein
MARGQLRKAAAASTQPDEAQPTPASPPDPLGRTTPRGTLLGFLTAASNHKYDSAAQYLDTRATGKDAATLANRLFLVLDRRLPAKLNNLSNDPLGSLSDPLHPGRELIGSVVTEEGGEVSIYLERFDRPNASPVWLFSKQTLAEIPDVYEEIDANTVERIVPDFLLRRYFGVSLLGWSFFLLFLPLEYLALSVINRMVGAALGYAIRRWAHRPEMGKPMILPHPVRLLIVSGTIAASLHRFGFSLIARQAGSTTAVLLLIVAFVWAVFLINERGEVYFKRRMESRGRLSATAVLRPARRGMDLIAIIAGLMFVLHALGINPTATLAGLGVGGIAIALAAQKTLENVIGGASLIMDGVVGVGDVLKIGDVVGAVETIGLRSTRVRTLDRTLVTIPNGQMATMTLENLSARDQFWLRHLISLVSSTPPSALNSVLGEVRTLLEQDASVLPETTRVRFLRFAESSLELELFAYISARDWNHFLEIQEYLLIKIRQVIASAGVELAYPSRAIYLNNKTGMDNAMLQPALHGAFADSEAGHEMHSR